MSSEPEKLEGLDVAWVEQMLAPVLSPELIEYLLIGFGVEPLPEAEPEEAEPEEGRLYLGSCRRGLPHSRRANCININATASSRNLASRALSPLYLQTAGGWPFENDWQYRKAYFHLGHFIEHSDGTIELTEAYWKWREAGLAKKTGKTKQKGIRTPAEVKRIKKLYPKSWRPTFSVSDDLSFLGYVESRWEIYFPMYQELIQDLPILSEVREMLRAGQDVMILDVDGPLSTDYPEGIEFTSEAFAAALEDESFPCGHGWGVCNVISQME